MMPRSTALFAALLFAAVVSYATAQTTSCASVASMKGYACANRTATARCSSLTSCATCTANKDCTWRLSTLKRINETGMVYMGVREASGALSYAMGNGKAGGFHVELCERALAAIKTQLKLAKMDIKYVNVTSSNRIPNVMNGTIDIECGSTTNNLARQANVSFAVTTYVETVRFAVRASSGITKLAQLNNKVVATTNGTTSAALLASRNITLKSVMIGKDHAESFSFLATGKADAFVMDSQILAGLIARSAKPSDFKISEEVLSVEPIAIMMRKDDPAFKKAVDDHIISLMKSGDVAKVYNKWFTMPIPPTNTSLNLKASAATLAAWAKPNDKPVEDPMYKVV